MEIYYTSYTLPVISQHLFACISRRTAFVSNPKSCDYSCHATAIRPPRDFRAARCERATSMRRIMEIAWKSRGRRVTVALQSYRSCNPHITNNSALFPTATAYATAHIYTRRHTNAIKFSACISNQIPRKTYISDFFSGFKKN